MGLPHVFTDASVTPTSTTIGIYCPQLSVSKSITLSRTMSPSMAEELAHLYARKIIPDAHYFTDNLTVATRLGIHWIPREYNKVADALTRPPTIPIIGHHLQAKYSLAHKLALIRKVTGQTGTTVLELYNSNHQLTRRLLLTLLKPADKPKAIKAALNDYKGISNSEFIQLFNRIRHA